MLTTRFVERLCKASSIVCKYFFHTAASRSVPFHLYRARNSHSVCDRYWSRKFKQHQEKKQSARMTTIPQLDIPDILVDDGEDDDDDDDARGGAVTPQTPVRDGGRWESPSHLSAGPRTSIHTGHSRNSSAATTNSTRSHRNSAWNHPLSFPRSASSTPSPPLSPSNLGFELRDVPGQPSSTAELRQRSGSVSPRQARDMLDDSVWMESIRRSTTSRRSDRGSHKYADLGK